MQENQDEAPLPQQYRHFTFGLSQFSGPLKGLSLTRPISKNTLSPYLSDPQRPRKIRGISGTRSANKVIKADYKEDELIEHINKIRRSRRRKIMIVACSILLLILVIVLAAIFCVMPESVDMIHDTMSGEPATFPPHGPKPPRTEPPRP